MVSHEMVGRNISGKSLSTAGTADYRVRKDATAGDA